jgi:GNAT superfamily N-acetyltransferase
METRVQPNVESDTEKASLQDGTVVRVRYIRPDDKALLGDAIRRLSPRSRYYRFAGVISELSPKALDHLTAVDKMNHVAWVAVDTAGEREKIVGVARYIREDDDPELAEVAVIVADSHQRRGLGILLLGKLAETARANGIRRFLAYVCCDNAPIFKLVHEFGAGVRLLGSGMARVTGSVPATLGGLVQSSY